MDWLILILGVPAILIPLVLLFGFAGCGDFAGTCTEDVDCPAGTRCVDGSCLVVGEPNPPPPPLAPENLAAIALDDRSVSLTWTNTDPAATDFEIERTPEDGEVDEVELIPAPDSPTGATDSLGLQEGVTYIYRVRALLGEERSEFSDQSSATVFPAAPVNLDATAVGIDQIDLSWTNASAIATVFSLEHRVPPGAFAEIIPGPGDATTFSHRGLDEGTTHEYRVFAVVDGVEDDVPREVKSAASAIVSETTLAFTAAFTAPPGTLTTELPAEGFCVVQRLSTTLFIPSSAGGTQVRILLRGPTTGSLTLDRVTISQVAATGDPYDAAPDLTDVVASSVTIPANTAVTVGPVNYTLDPTQDLLVAFDISNTPGEGNLPFGPLMGADAFSRDATAEAGVQDRTTGYPNIAPNTLSLIEQIDVV
jgi:Fibronectin type III domain